mmetsp:Transcript_107944/g.286035  ORF Transcript_107944/g.286035 Transcript_107944/m.286035 type:complete len:231 (-) Transcript_107944:245-937(-)
MFMPGLGSRCTSVLRSFMVPSSHTWRGTSNVRSNFGVDMADPSMHFRLGVRGARAGKLDESEREVLTPAADPVRACFGVGRAAAKSASMPCTLAVSKSEAFPTEGCNTGKLSSSTSRAFAATDDDALLEHLDVGVTSSGSASMPKRDGHTSGSMSLLCKLAELKGGKPSVPNPGARFASEDDDPSFEPFGVGVAIKRSSISCKLNDKVDEPFSAGLADERMFLGDLFGEV